MPRRDSIFSVVICPNPIHELLIADQDPFRTPGSFLGDDVRILRTLGVIILRHSYIFEPTCVETMIELEAQATTLGGDGL